MHVEFILIHISLYLKLGDCGILSSIGDKHIKLIFLIAIVIMKYIVYFIDINCTLILVWLSGLEAAILTTHH